MKRPLGLVAPLALTLLLLAGHAGAQAKADPDALFTEGVTLLEAGNYEGALAKFEEVQRLAPGIGNQFNIGTCYEKLGKLGSAYRAYDAVVQVARASGKKQREDASRARLDELRPKVAVFVVTARDPDVTVSIDGAALNKKDWELYAVDPGDHVVTATAPERKAWTTKIAAPAPGQRTTVAVPPLEIAKETITVTKETTNTKRTLGFIAGGVGLAGLVVAGVTGAMIIDDKSTAASDCVDPNGQDKLRCRTDAGRDAVSRGETLLPINAIAFGVGVVGVLAGAYLILTSGPDAPPKKALRFLPLASTAGGDLQVTF